MLTKLRLLSARRVGAALLLAGLLGSACGCREETKLFPVSGKVTVNGKPLTSGFVRFAPDKAKGNPFGGEPIGEINDQGEYTLNYMGKPGAPMGAYKITVTSMGATGEDNTKVKPKNTVRMTYANASTTPLTVEVTATPAAGAYDLKLAPP
jgi:hypothetical protein